MAVLRDGGVSINGGSTPMGQPSRKPGSVREDVAPFRVPFDRDKFTQLIKVHGYDVVWEKATFCPFLKGPNPKDHDINCTACRQGFIYFDAQCTRMNVQSISVSQQYFAYGRFDSGKVQLTAYPEFKMSFWDRITLIKSRSRFSELIKRGRGTLRDKFRYVPIQVFYLTWALNEKTFITAVAHQNIDFTIDAVTGEIVWQTTNRPGADVYYSVSYFFRPMYIVLDVPHNIRDQDIPKLDEEITEHFEFPVQVMAQMDHFIRDEGRDRTDEGDTKNPFPTSSQDLPSSA